MAIAESAWEGYKAFREELTDVDAQQRIKLLHTAHIRKMIAGDMLAGDGAVIVTEIANFDLSLVDAHFPGRQQRQVTLLSRLGADFIISVLSRRGYPIQVQL